MFLNILNTSTTKIYVGFVLFYAVELPWCVNVLGHLFLWSYEKRHIHLQMEPIKTKIKHKTK